MILKEVDFDKIDVGFDSPRIPKSIEGKTTEDLVPYFLFHGALAPLVGSLSVLGWFPTEFLILQEKYDGRYTVVDGNRRFIACWLMLHTDNMLCPGFIRDAVREMNEEEVLKLRTLKAMVIEA